MSDPASPPSPTPEELHGLDPGELLARGLNTPRPTGNAHTWVPPEPDVLSRLLPQYRIERLLGRGGMGAVYQGTQPSLDRPVAIKLLPAELAADPDFLTRFQREARTLARLQHPGIVAVHDFGQTAEGHLYFVMEYVDGTDLRHVLKGPGLKPEQAFELISQICDALYYAHRQGVIHRDIKPANILLTRDGRAKLADFGLARPLNEETGGLTMTNMIMGTPDYMAPETRKGATHADHRADIFALGVMLYEMLTGQRPHGAFQPPSQRVQVDVRIDEVVLKALQQEPERRYQQASEMKSDVEHIRTTPPQKANPARGRRRTSAFWASVTILLIFLGSLAFFAIQRPKPGDFSSFSPATTAPGNINAIVAERRRLVKSILSKRGFVSIAHGLNSVDIRRFDDLPDGRFRLLHVDQVEGDFDDSDAALLVNFPELVSIRLHRCSVTALPIQALPNLENLELGECAVTLAGLRDLAGHSKLKRAHLHGAQISREVIGILVQCPSLEYVALVDIDLRDGDLDSLEQLKRLKEVNVISNLSDAGLAALAGIPTLEKVSLGKLNPKTVTLSTFLQTSATHLHLYNCTITRAMLDNIAKAPKLQWLYFEGGKIAEDSLEPLFGMRQLNSFILKVQIRESVVNEIQKALPHVKILREPN